MTPPVSLHARYWIGVRAFVAIFLGWFFLRMGELVFDRIYALAGATAAISLATAALIASPLPMSYILGWFFRIESMLPEQE